MFELKKIDQEILNELAVDSRQSFRNIAKKIGVSVSTVIKRVELLQKDGIIKQFTISVNHQKIGYDYHALIEIVTVQQKLREVEDFLRKRSEVYSVYVVTGSNDLAALIRAKTQDELREFMRVLVDHPSIERTETRIIFDTIKEHSHYF